MNELFFNSSKQSKDKQLKTTKSLDNTLNTSIAHKTFNSINSKADNTQRTYTSKDNPDFDNYIYEDDYENFFIDPEYQKLIFELLQMVRKKVKYLLDQKINPLNAFEVPLAVMNPEATQSIDMRFWKFASQLLNASMYVYDKRVQNTFQTSHKVFNNLMRSQNNQQVPEEKSQTKSKKKSMAEVYSNQIVQIGSSKFLASINICQDSNREDPDKLNIKAKNCMPNVNPYFVENSKKFDSHSLKNLFLNVLEQSSDLQINIIKPKIEASEEIKPQRSEQLSSSCLEIQFSTFINQTIAKLSIDLKSNSLFNQITKFAESKLDHSNLSLVSDIIRDIEAEYEVFSNHNYSSGFNNIEVTSLGSNFSQNSNRFSFNFVTNPDIGRSLSEQINNQDIDSNQFKSERSSNVQIELLFIQNDDYVFTPREFQFRNLNLIQHKKKRIRNVKDNKESKNFAKGVEDIAFDLQNDYKMNSRENVLMIQTNMLRIYQSNKAYKQNYLHGISINPYLNYYRVNNRHYSKQSQQNSTNKSLKIKAPVEQQLTDLFQAATFIENSNSNSQSIFKKNQTGLDQSLTLLDNSLRSSIPNFGYRYIRNVKNSILDQINLQSQAFLSTMDSSISVASTFIVFLHLVNQKMLSIQTLNNDSDVRLYKSLDDKKYKIKDQI